MNLVLSEADSREFLLNRFHRRVESYRLHHEHNSRLYQPIRREEVRKQLEETNQLHKKWIEFQAKRSVGRTKTDASASCSSTLAKKPKKKLLVSHETSSVLSSTCVQPILNDINKSISEMQSGEPSICSNVKRMGYSQSILSIRPFLNSNLDSELYHVSQNNKELTLYPNFKSVTVDSHPAFQFQDVKNQGGNFEKLNDEREMENFLMDEEWDKFWDTLSKDGEMPKEVLQVLQENESDEPSGMPASFNPSLFLDSNPAITDLNKTDNGLSTLDLIPSFVSTDMKSDFHLSGSVIRNNPNIFDQNAINSNKTVKANRFGSGDFSNSYDRLPSYDDVVNGRHILPSQLDTSNTYTCSQFYGNGLMGEAYGHHMNSHHQNVYNETINFTYNKESMIHEPNSFGYNFDAINISPYKSCTNQKYLDGQSSYPNNVQHTLGDTFSDPGFRDKSHCKLNSTTNNFVNQQQPYSLHLNESQVAEYQNVGRASHYWNPQGKDDAPYKNQRILKNSDLKHTPCHPFVRKLNNFNLGGKHHANIYTEINESVSNPSGLSHSIPLGSSMDTELNMIEDIIGKK